MRAGELRHRVQLQQAIVARDTFSAEVTTWNTLTTVWAHVAVLSGSEAIAQLQIDATLTHTIVIRYYPILVPAMRAVWDGKVLEIHAVVPDEKKQMMTLLCSAEVEGEARGLAPWGAVLNGTSALINAGNQSSLTDMHSGDMTIEGWFKIAMGTGAGKAVICKTTNAANGWSVVFQNATQLKISIMRATPAVSLVAFTPDNVFHHCAFTFSLADLKARIFIDGMERSYLSQVAGVGGIITSGGADLTVGNILSVYTALTVGWLRISNSVRYTATFLPFPRDNPPIVDVHTVRLFRMNEGSGTVIGDASSNAQNASLINGAWGKFPVGYGAP